VQRLQYISRTSGHRGRWVLRVVLVICTRLLVVSINRPCVACVETQSKSNRGENCQTLCAVQWRSRTRMRHIRRVVVVVVAHAPSSYLKRSQLRLYSEFCCKVTGNASASERNKRGDKMRTCVAPSNKQQDAAQDRTYIVAAGVIPFHGDGSLLHAIQGTTRAIVAEDGSLAEEVCRHSRRGRWRSGVQRFFCFDRRFRDDHDFRSRFEVGRGHVEWGWVVDNKVIGGRIEEVSGRWGGSNSERSGRRLNGRGTWRRDRSTAGSRYWNRGRDDGAVARGHGRGVRNRRRNHHLGRWCRHRSEGDGHGGDRRHSEEQPHRHAARVNAGRAWIGNQFCTFCCGS